MTAENANPLYPPLAPSDAPPDWFVPDAMVDCEGAPSPPVAAPSPLDWIAFRTEFPQLVPLSLLAGIPGVSCPAPGPNAEPDPEPDPGPDPRTELGTEIRAELGTEHDSRTGPGTAQSDGIPVGAAPSQMELIVYPTHSQVAR
ncbi:hypothetical protein P152DRAFT_445059 [Eremomyces bilateralis CBS 781.70]|uniref:Uncharacterized protein n=1 Tax=Eremomyces bilateralis CBS 781.70 TaxID=1392243 RepID=A0A6G1GG35_9PEZI|nr:uncharacterized protein P152DRAFT_445059 [Eremomyces bilateralis CBS 781.70]KAF1816886.1 hypothetical protein P152DRAFT_445059 [Eremomyces bilateralis CBS 781.70]